MAVIQIGFATFSGLGTETKPTTGIGVDTTFYETDTKLTWLFNGTDWILEAGLVPSLNQTPDLPPPFYRWNDKKAGQQKRVKWRDDMGMDWLLKMKPDSSTVLWSSDLAMNGLFTITVSGVGILYWGDGTFDRYDGTDVVLTHTYTGFNGTIYFKGTLTKINNKTPGSNLKHDIGSIPNGVIHYHNEGNNTTSGNIASLPLTLTYYTNLGHNTTSGDIARLPRGLTIYNNQGASITHGNIGHLPPLLINYIDQGRNITAGDIGSMPNTLKVIIVGGNNLISDYVKGTHVWANNYIQFNLMPAIGFGLDSTEVDNLIIDLSKVTWGNSLVYKKGLLLLGGNAPRTTASDTAVMSLRTQGVRVTTN